MANEIHPEIASLRATALNIKTAIDVRAADLPNRSSKLIDKKSEREGHVATLAGETKRLTEILERLTELKDTEWISKNFPTKEEKRKE